MARIFDRSIEAQVAEHAHRAEQWFNLRFDDRAAFNERLRAGLGFSGKDVEAENKLALTKHMGLFSLELFQAMMCGGEQFKPMFVSILWDRLLDAGVIMKAIAAMKGTPFVDHQINEALLMGHLRDGTFVNLFASPARLPERYSHAVAAVDVLKSEDQSRGTGFVVAHGSRQYFVTCKHNVDPADGITLEAVTSAAGEPLRLGEMVLSEQFDIAVAPLREVVSGPCFALSDVVEIFDEVFTLGYPKVPRAESILLGHRGEVNGLANLYRERCPALLISNLVSPGSSGGPVLTRDGHCVGMTINWLEGEFGEKEKLATMRFSAALPADLLRKTIEQ
jgi:S1-C subfamily serine protease